MNPSRSILAAGGLVLSVWIAPPAGAACSEILEYDITWVGISVGTMLVRSETGTDGGLLRSIRIWNRPWIALVYPVDNAIQCRIEATAEGPRHVVAKVMGEKNFRQDDTLVLWPDAGRAAWSNAVGNLVCTFDVPQGARDYVSFFFDLRDAAGQGRLNANGDYQLVMDDKVHALEIQAGAAETIRTPRGRMAAIPVKAISRSPTLFSRNRPKSVWVAASQPVVIFADVETRFGPVRGTLVKWEVDGKPVEWKASKPTAD